MITESLIEHQPHHALVGDDVRGGVHLRMTRRVAIERVVMKEREDDDDEEEEEEQEEQGGRL
jgi:hypothetical protein